MRLLQLHTDNMLLPIPIVRKPSEERSSGIWWHQRHDSTDYFTLLLGSLLQNMTSLLVTELSVRSWGDFLIWQVTINKEFFFSSGWMDVQSCDFDLLYRFFQLLHRQWQKWGIFLSISPDWKLVNINQGSHHETSAPYLNVLYPILCVGCLFHVSMFDSFLPSWPCSLKCNKSCIPRLCCTSIRCSSGSW